MRFFLSATFVFLMVSIGLRAQTPSPTPQDHFRKGLELLRTKQFDTALEEFQASERADGGRPETLANKGAALMGMRRFSDAAAAFRKAISLKPLEPTFHTALCKALESNREDTAALEECREGVRLGPDSVVANVALIDVLPLTSQDTSETTKQIDQIVSRFRETVEILAIAARYYERMGDLGRSIELFGQASAIRPADPYWLAVQAELYLRTNQESSAVNLARRALQLDPQQPIANFFMGKIFLELGLNREARDSFAIAAGADDDAQVDAQYYLALSEERLGHHQAALTSISRAAQRVPESFTLQREYGNVLHSLRKYPEAVDQFRRALKLRPNDYEAGVGLASAYFGNHDFANAIQVLEPLSRQRPDDQSVVGMLLRVARARLANIPSIDEAKEQALREPENIQLRVDLIMALSYSGRVSEMDTYSDQVWKLQPKNVRQAVWIAVAYSEAGLTDKAVEAYERARTISDDPAIHLGLAYIYGEKGEIEKAYRSYDKVLELNPQAPDTMKLYADLLRDNGKRNEALAMYRRSLSLKPSSPVVLFNATLLSLKLGDPVSAKIYLEQLRPLDAPLAIRVDRIIRLKLWAPVN